MLYISYNNWEKILVAVIDKSKKRLSREVNPVEVSRGRPTVLIPGMMLPVHQENSRESSSISSSVRSSSTSASSSTVAAAKGATAATTATATAATKTSPAPTSKPAAQKDQRIPIVDLENVVNSNNKGNKNKNEHEVNLSPEQEDKNYAKEMTTELEMFAHPAENNNGQNLQNNSSTTKGGGKGLLLSHCYFHRVKNPYWSLVVLLKQIHMYLQCAAYTVNKNFSVKTMKISRT